MVQLLFLYNTIHLYVQSELMVLLTLGSSAYKILHDVKQTNSEKLMLQKLKIMTQNILK